MADLALYHAQTEQRISRLLAQLVGFLTETEHAEVTQFLRAGEYGLALDTLACILVEEQKPVAAGLLAEIESLAESMDLLDAGCMHDLHTWYDRQSKQRDAAY